MTIAKTGAVYVAQLLIPMQVLGTPSARHEIEAKKFFGIAKGYWEVAFDTDDLGTDRPTGIRATVELPAEDRESAENHMLQFAGRFATLLGFHFGSPEYPPRLERLAMVGDYGGVVEQSEYIYQADSFRFGRVGIRSSLIAQLSSRMGALDEELQDRVERSQRWYRSSISSDDPLDAYVAAWIGFECIGPRLNDKFHPKGPNQECEVCTEAESGRNRDQATFEHIAAQVAPEILHAKTWADLEALRGAIVHGHRTADELRIEVRSLLKDFQLVVSTGILSMMARGVEHPTMLGAWPAYLPRVTENRPDRRFWIRYEQELTDVEPFLGGWAELSWEWVNARSELKPDGSYTWGAGIRVSWHAKSKTGPGVEAERGCETYARFGTTWTDRPDLYVGEGQSPCDEIVWHGEQVPASWQRIVDKNQETSSKADQP